MTNDHDSQKSLKTESKDSQEQFDYTLNSSIFARYQTIRFKKKKKNCQEKPPTTVPSNAIANFSSLVGPMIRTSLYTHHTLLPNPQTLFSYFTCKNFRIQWEVTSLDYQI